MKSQRYAELVAKRKACRECAPDLTNPSVILGGTLDCDHVGAFSQWQGNLDAELLVVGQDFANVDTFKQCPWPGAKVRTNLTLVKLAKSAGFEIHPPKMGCPDDQLFFTNAVLCIKQGPMQAKVEKECSARCGRLFLRRTIDLVGPRAVAALGEHAVRAVLGAYDIGWNEAEGIVRLVKSGSTFSLPAGIRVFPLCHPNPTVLNRHRSLKEQKSDWARLGAWLRIS